MSVRKQTSARVLSDWFEARGWRAFAFQKSVWRSVLAKRSGLLHATTGSGKTFAVWLGVLGAFGALPPPLRSEKKRILALPDASAGAQAGTEAHAHAGLSADVGAKANTTSRTKFAAPLTALWITPMRALAADTMQALGEPLHELAPHWTLGMRTGDTTSAQRAAQDKRLPSALVTTPESLSLLLARADARERLAHVKAVVVDEWHELMGNKRGTQTQLALARLRAWNPELVVWGLSATLGNQPQALNALLGTDAAAHADIVQGRTPKVLRIDTLLPAQTQRFPWAGHLGMSMLPAVLTEIESFDNTLVFVNTRSQAELWYQALLEARPQWAGLLALHHGSLDQITRNWVESQLKAGALKAVVCTSSLDLGVDFHPVQRVLQIGSPKGVARLMQRAGRSGHAPGRPSRITLVPTHMLEVVEAAAAREASERGEIESRRVPEKPLDVLVQHLVTVALGGGFTQEALFDEVRSAYAYRNLNRAEWMWALDFVRRGGQSLVAYPDYRRAEPDEQGVWRVADARLARRHRMSIGTIVSDANMTVRYWSGRGGGARLGTVEESFIARLNRGDCFLFAGRLLELVRTHEMTAYVRRATGRRAAVPRWNGGRMPLSSELAHAMVRQLGAAAQGHYDSPELKRVRALLDLQARWSSLPGESSVLAETLSSREGTHLFLYPFAGRHAHLGLASLLAWRVARSKPVTFSMAVNDYGLELLTTDNLDWAQILTPALFDDARLLEDILDSLNASELAQRRFREIARVSGLVFSGYPGANKGAKQLQASSGLFYEVLRNHDPSNMLLGQAEREVLEQELDLGRLREALAHLRDTQMAYHVLERPTPFAFPLMVERFREKLSTEKLADRLARMLADLERAADAPDRPKTRRPRRPPTVESGRGRALP